MTVVAVANRLLDPFETPKVFLISAIWMISRIMIMSVRRTLSERETERYET